MPPGNARAGRWHAASAAASGWCGGEWGLGGFGNPGGGEAAAGGVPGGSVLKDQILGDLAPAQRQELGELVLVRFAGDAAAYDHMGRDALIPYRAAHDKAENLELRIGQQAAEPLEPAKQACPARQPCSQRGPADEDELAVRPELPEYLVKVPALDRGQPAKEGAGCDPADQVDAADRCAHGCHGGHLR